MDADDVRNIPLPPSPQPGTTAKRGRSAISTAFSGEATTRELLWIRRPATSSRPKKSCNVVKVGIISEQFPTVKLTDQELRLLQDRLSRLILHCDSTSCPSFQKTIFHPGYLVISCDNMAVANWVKNQEDYIQVIKGKKIEVIFEKDFPYPHVVMGVFPGSRYNTIGEILSFIEIQNKMPAAAQWNVLRRENRKVLISIEPASFEALKALDFTVSYRMGRVRLLPQ